MLERKTQKFSLLFLSGIIITTSSFKKALNELKSLIGIFKFSLNNIDAVSIHLITAFFEEFVWRVTLQSLTSKSYLDVWLIASFFTLKHYKTIKYDYRKIIDFFIFSLSVGILYFLFQDVILIVIIHLIRNLNILYFYKSASGSGK